jgi:hypothetical protein
MGKYIERKGKSIVILNIVDILFLVMPVFGTLSFLVQSL